MGKGGGREIEKERGGREGEGEREGEGGREREGEERERKTDKQSLFVGWLLNVPATG